MAKVDVVSPFDGSKIGDFELCDEAALERKLAAAHAIYEDRSRWLTKEARIQILGRLAELLEADVENAARLAASEGGKPLLDSRVEVRRAVEGIRKAQSGVSNLTGHEVPMDVSAASRGRFAVTYLEPRGVVLAVSAFNHPLNLLVHQGITAIAAGCPVLIKPSRRTPLSALYLRSLLEKAGLPEGYAEILLTDGELTRRAVADPRVAFLTFIGSAKVGWSLRKELAPGAQATFEHGGVAPVLLDETADFDAALPLITKGGYYHAGQVCVSVQRVFVPRPRARDFAAKLAERASALKVGSPLLETTEVGPLIEPSEVQRVGDWVSEAREKGAEILCGGKPISERLYEPTVLYAPRQDVRISREEVFGPVVAVYPYDEIDQAVTWANLPGAYFQAALFTNRLDRALDLGRRLHGTTVLVNDHTAFRVDWMPFGGHRDSGLGIGGIEQSMHDMSLQRMLVLRAPG
ncbi:MAG: aldehyde dehydrogenase [Sorangiineae bacterium NIC37A_2]|jgi:acyl-CoA reductase-like NAD-dependent aldehyde dehydrogenase|nr:MAG: aldehyde dehydrogenase [Sorangiineae bacterium NIC37A_2]